MLFSENASGKREDSSFSLFPQQNALTIVRNARNLPQPCVRV